MATGDYALVAQANQAPYRCVRCKRAENCIVLNQEPIPGYGIVYLCAVCYGELTDATDFMRRADHNRALESILREMEQLRLKFAAKQDELQTALADVRVFKERLSNGVRDLVDRSISDLLAGDGGGADVVLPAPAEPAEDDERRGAGPAADAVPGGAGPGADLLAGIAGLRARAAHGDAGAAAPTDGGSGEAGDVFDFISEPDAG